MSGVGAWLAASQLSDRLGIPVTTGGIEELAARGLVSVVKVHRKYGPQYSDDDLAAVTREQAEAAEAGRLLNRYEAAKRLGIRQRDFDLLVTAGVIVPDKRKRGHWQGWVLLFYPATLDAFAARPDVDMDAARAVKRGRSPLAGLAEPGLAWLALGGDPAGLRVPERPAP